MRQTLNAILVAAAILTPVAAQAGWQDEASSFDQSRLARLGQAREQGLAESNGVAQAVLSAPATGGSITGNYRCRTIKLGGMTPSKEYTWFHCRVFEDGGMLRFEKTSGSQRMAGTLYPDGNGYVYLGASWVKGEPPHRYSGNGASVGAVATPDDQIGRMTAISGGARLEMPYPVQESTFDVVELRR
ncbi:MAG TPA: DUF4893 domain-containing protein [Rhizomicrobium sp.]|nr:DUF4893 domain-containing protein [Rhizomicrobium sp.]